MALLHEFIKEAEYLHCKISGTYDNVWESVSLFRELILQSRCSGLSKILYDSRDMINYPGATERVIYMSEIIDQHDVYLGFGGTPLYIAFLGNEDLIYSYSPGLDVAASRGFAAINTSNLQEAMTWFQDWPAESGSNGGKDTDSLKIRLAN